MIEHKKSNCTGFSIKETLVYVGVLLIILLLLGGIANILEPKLRYSPKIICGTNMSGIGKAILAYSASHNSKLPTPEKWCDLLIEEKLIVKEKLICKGAAETGDEGPCNYAMNLNCRPDSPNDVVLLFETSGGWNQHGGPEMLTLENHQGKGCNILFSDGYVEFVKAEDIGKLNWEVGPEEVKVELQVGDEAPGFGLVDQDRERVRLSDFAGKKVLVYFYPKAGTPGCTKQACSVRDSAEALKRAGVVPLGISPDEPNEQQRFDEEYGLGFRLLSDEGHKVAEAYGVWGQREIGGKKSMGIIRSSFLMDEKGKLIGVWYNIRPEDTVPKAMEALK